MKIHTLVFPKLPDFCMPYSAGSTFNWLSQMIEDIAEFGTQEKARHQRKIDVEVDAAIFLFLQIGSDPELQSAWCHLEQWAGLRKKPTVGDTTNLLEEVFRLIWAISQNDADGYELRLTAVRAVLDSGVAPQAVTRRIRAEGGFVAVRNRIRDEKHEAGKARDTAIDLLEAEQQAIEPPYEPPEAGPAPVSSADWTHPLLYDSRDVEPADTSGVRKLEVVELLASSEHLGELMRLGDVPDRFARITIRPGQRRPDGWLPLELVRVKIKGG